MKIVMTGGPSAGKTTVAETIARQFHGSIVVVREAASILFQGGFPRSPDGTTVRHVQKAIYYVQRELEDTIADLNPKKLLLCDRGSLDGLAYWPGSSKSFFDSVDSNMRREIKRYDWVIHLDTAGPKHYDRSNPIRSENYEAAMGINNKIKHAWRQHPRRIVITNSDLFFRKIDVALKIIYAIQQGATYDDILNLQRKVQTQNIAPFLQETP